MPYPKAGESVAQATRYFLNGSVDGHTGIVAYDKAHPGARFTDAIQAVRQSAYPELYQQWEREARSTVREYLGGEGGSTSTAVTTTKRYAFQVGKTENYWDALKRLAEEVNWRCFVVGKSVYFIAEPTLFKSRRRMILAKTPGGSNPSTGTLTPARRRTPPPSQRTGRQLAGTARNRGRP